MGTAAIAVSNCVSSCLNPPEPDHLPIQQLTCACNHHRHRADNGNTVTPKHIESGPAKMAAEFAAMGIDIKAILKGKVFMYNEFGMGGGLSECGDVPGKTPLAFDSCV